MGEPRLIDANQIVEVAKHAYNEWNLAMATQDTNRGVNKVLKMQELCKCVEAVANDAPTIDPETLPIVKELQSEIKTLKKMKSEYLCMMVDIFDILNAMYGSCGKFCDDCIQEFWDKWGDDSKKSGFSEEEKKERNKFIRDVLNKKIVFYDGENKKEE